MTIERDKTDSERLVSVEAAVATMRTALTDFITASNARHAATESKIDAIRAPRTDTFIAAGGLLCVMIAGAWAIVNGPISNNAKSIDRVEAGLIRQIERETERNNKLEREMGAVLKVDELFGLGRLKLETH